MGRKRHSLAKRLCRLTTYLTSAMLGCSGLIFLVIGAYFVNVLSRAISTDFSSSSSSSSSVSVSLPAYVWIPILLGCCLLLGSVLGCCGAKRYNRILLALYIILVIAIFIVQLVVAAILISNSAIINASLGLSEDDANSLKAILSSSQQAVRTSFIVVSIVEVFVIFSSVIFCRQITGDELETKYHMDLDKQEVEVEREKRKMQFEMQARRVASSKHPPV
mmetsp:Transcript_19306/g.63891  ORF Transcript_19306/g.63891 Transcript_19306/m.63891 type:complete len:220 (-) Transcript_19306:3502-4161(-)